MYMLKTDHSGSLSHDKSAFVHHEILDFIGSVIAPNSSQGTIRQGESNNSKSYTENCITY